MYNQEKLIFDYKDPLEVDVVRHFTRLSQLNFCVDTGFYPLGSCTMKYNPKLNEDVAKFPGFAKIHPYQNPETVPGMVQLLEEFAQQMCDIFGYDDFYLEPVAGAHGELAGMLTIRNYFLDKGEERSEVIVPDSAHGTNPASAAMAGYKVITVPSTKDGYVDCGALRGKVSDKTAALMLTNPNTLGLLEPNIEEIASIVHGAGGLLYYDGANANALVGRLRPGDLGFDVAHINLHKTFAAPHGGGGPGSGPIGVKAFLKPYLPKKMHAFHGNIGVIVKSYTYLKTLGKDGLSEVSRKARENANYIKEKLTPYYDVPFKQECEHEFVISCADKKKKYGVKALDIAKRIIDYGFHPPTVYFPLIVHECMMIEPTETESRETLDEFIAAMIAIAKECETDPELIKHAPYNTPVKRLDDVKAVKEPRLKA
ncbi:MAG: glycine dehydrogenase subunit 2 [Candidatus Margulisiibacteriota bacterium]